MDRWKGKVAIVTGASSGIGAGIAERLVNGGLKVAGLARRKERLDELATKLESTAGEFHPIECDLSKEDDILKAFQWIKENLGQIHILVNNAGILRKTNLIDGDTSMWKEIFDINVISLCIATREAVKDMRSNNVDGHIIHINSLAGHQVPNYEYLNVYGASKYAVTALTQTLINELKSIGSNIKTTSISPGLVNTEISVVCGMFTEGELDNIVKNHPILRPEDVADAIVYVLSTPPQVQVRELTVISRGEVS